MGFWGNQLYQNDLALDVKDQLEKALQQNEKNIETITQEIITSYKGVQGNIFEEPAFWLALADTQWRAGVLLPSVKEKAFFWIDQMLEDQDHNRAYSFQKRMLERLRIRLLSHQPPVKFPVKRRTYHCQWNFGDVYAFPLESNFAKQKGYVGEYLLFQKVDEASWYPGHTVPVVYVKMTHDKKLPGTAEEYDRLAFIQTSFSKYEERFNPIDGTRPREDIAEKSKMQFETDEFGLLPEYRVLLLNTSKRIIPKNLIFLGNYQNTMQPKKEFVPFSNINLPVVGWSPKMEPLDEKIIRWYEGHNLRRLSIYQ